MSGKFKDFSHRSVKNFFDALINIFLFLPSYFSVKTLFKTLFQPWKNLVSHKTERGFSFGDWFNRLSFDLISRFIGFVMRISIIIFYLIFQVLLLVLFPLIGLIYILMLPLLFFFALFTPTEEQMKEKRKERFVASHTIKPENRDLVENWFEQLYKLEQDKAQWWAMKNLMAMPPLARDWAVGYTPILDEYAEDMTTPHYQMRIRPHIIGREKEAKQIEQVLSQSEEANVILVGEEGVGKHTIIDAVAKQVYEGTINNLLAYKRILYLNMEKILTEYTDQKQREAFMEELLQEAAEAKNIILLMDNIDKYVSSGTERIDLSVPLEKYGHTSAVQIIGITTPFMYEKYIFTNDKISQMFTKLEVAEISKREAMLILMDMVALYESRYRLVLPFETLLTTIEKSDFFITTIPFPEKALQLVDTACVYTQQNLKTKVVTPEIIDVVLTQKTHTPTTLSDQIKEKLLQLEKLLSNKVIHQDEAINELASALRRSFLLLGKRKKPLASFLFLGPTGVGKTETAKAISQTFFGSDKYMIRFDMSLYQTKAEIPALVGSIETLNPGLLTNAIREKPYGVLLLDEIEKADKDLLNIFLTILDEGYFTDGFGKRVDCKNLVIIATSNAGADWIYKQNKQPELQNVTNKLQTLITDQPAVTQPQTNNTNALINYLITQRLFSPEFLNRFDGVISFQALGQDSAVIIARKMLNNIITQIFDLYKVKVIVSDATLQAITQQGYDPAFGGRNLERILRDQITDKIAKLILENKVKEGDMITL